MDLITELNFTKFNGCPRQAYLIEHARGLVKSRQDRNTLSSRLRDVQNDMLASFPDGVSVYGDVRHAAQDTAYIIQKNEKTIFGATFMVGNISCRCDVIMLNEMGEYDIYAVRPTSRYTRWIDEVLFCKIVMQKAGVKVGRAYVCAVDREGIKNKILEVICVDNPRRTQKLACRLESIIANIKKDSIPPKCLSKQCGACVYMKDCFQTDTESIFTLKSIPFTKKMSLYQKGIKTLDEYEKLPDADKNALREIIVRKTDEDVYNKEEINGFLSRLKYPLGFLDFETMEVFVPNDSVLSPMDTVITQFSYHLIEKEGDEAVHYEFIGDGVSYPEREAARMLCECIKNNHTVLMYSEYERVCIERLIKRLPEYTEPLEEIKANLVDLEKPFSSKMLVNRRMEGKSSLKKVYPALYHNEEVPSYSHLKIQNGQQAESVYARLCRMDEEERRRAIEDLKEYCALDTLAMIKLWEKLEYYGKMV